MPTRLRAFLLLVALACGALWLEMFALARRAVVAEIRLEQRVPR